MKSLTKWLCHKPTIGASAFAAGENATQPRTSKIVPNVMFNLFILNFVCCLAFFDFSSWEVSSGRSLMYCARFDRLLREKRGLCDFCCRGGDEYRAGGGCPTALEPWLAGRIPCVETGSRGLAASRRPFCHVERKSRPLLLFLCQKVRDSSAALGMTKKAFTRDEPALWRRLRRSVSAAEVQWWPIPNCKP